MKEKSQSKIARRTRKWITDALISLMDKKDFSAITITEIVERADVSRQSFYRHYETKEEIIDDFFNENIVKKFKVTFRAEPEDTIYKLLEFYFNFWYENIYVMELVISTNYPLQVFDEYDQLLRTHLAESLNILAMKMNTGDEEEKEIMKSFIIGGLYNTKIQWTKSNYEKTPAEMARIVERMFNNFGMQSEETE